MRLSTSSVGLMTESVSEGLKDWNRVPTIADYLDVSDKAVWRWIASGRLEAARFGKSVRISRDQVTRFIKSGTESAM